MALRLRRRQDDDGPARPAYPPLRDRRDRKRELALQEPRLSRKTPAPGSPPPRVPPVGTQAPPTRVAPSLVRALRVARGALLCTTGITRQRGQHWTPIRGQYCAPFDTFRGSTTTTRAAITTTACATTPRASAATSNPTR